MINLEPSRNRKSQRLTNMRRYKNRKEVSQKTTSKLVKSDAEMASVALKKKVQQKTQLKLAKKGNVHHLTQIEAMYRSSIVQNVSYKVSLGLPKGKVYFGQVEMEFHLKQMGEDNKPLFLDFYGVDVGDILINDK